MSGVIVVLVVKQFQGCERKTYHEDESKALIADTRSLTVFSQTDDVRRANLVESAVTDINNRCHLVSYHRERATELPFIFSR